MAFDFSVIGDIISNVMDTDEIDIYRQGVITMPDGSVAPIPQDRPYYAGVKCHISRNTIDNPDAPTGAIPIIVNITINCPIWVDIIASDIVEARKLAADGEVLWQERGRIGAPFTDQSRKTILMAVRQGA